MLGSVNLLGRMRFDWGDCFRMDAFWATSNPSSSHSKIKIVARQRSHAFRRAWKTRRKRWPIATHVISFSVVFNQIPAAAAVAAFARAAAKRLCMNKWTPNELLGFWLGAIKLPIFGLLVCVNQRHSTRMCSRLSRNQTTRPAKTREKKYSAKRVTTIRKIVTEPNVNSMWIRTREQKRRWRKWLNDFFSWNRIRAF